jgi:predicted nucleotide-binding protein
MTGSKGAELREHRDVLEAFERDYRAFVDAQLGEARNEIEVDAEWIRVRRADLLRRAARAGRALRVSGCAFGIAPPPAIGGPPLEHFPAQVFAHENPLYSPSNDPFMTARIVLDSLGAGIGSLDDAIEQAEHAPDEPDEDPPGSSKRSSWAAGRAHGQGGELAPSRQMSRPTMFIGSSGEGLRIAQALQAELEHDVDATIWSQGVFGLSGGTLESLVDATGRFEFAALVLTPDDLVTKRGETGNAPRDNVIFEAGLFMGALGRLNTFLVSCRDDHLDLPSDLAGITRAEYNRRLDLRAGIGPVATNIRAAVEAAVSARGSSASERENIEAVKAASVPASSPEDADANLPRLIAAVDVLREQFKARPAYAPLSTEQGRLFNALLAQVKRARPHDPLVPLLPQFDGSDDQWSDEPPGDSTGYFERAIDALEMMRSALVSGD